MRHRRLLTAAAALVVAAGVAVSVLNTAPRAEAKADANPGARDVIVHLFDDKSRDYYGLEDLWSDARRVPLSPELSVRSAAE